MTDPRLEAAARAIVTARGQDPDANPSGSGTYPASDFLGAPRWTLYVSDARAALASFLAQEASEGMRDAGTNTLGHGGIPISREAAAHCWRAMCAQAAEELKG